MKSIRGHKILLVWLLILSMVGVMGMSVGCSKTDASKSEESTAEDTVGSNATLESYGLNVQVQSKHRLLVTETLTVRYPDTITGVQRIIPYEGYRLNPETNEITEYRMILDHVEADVDYTIRKKSGKAYLTLGKQEAEDEVSGGTQVYTLKYRLSCYQDQDSSQDQFFCTLLPYGWEQPIRSATINISMPKDFESTGVTLYRYSGGVWGASDISGTVSGKNITEYLEEADIQQNPQLSLVIRLPEGYFKGEKSLLPVPIFFYALIAVLTVGIVVLWWLFGTSNSAKKLPEDSVQKHKLTPLEDAYLLRRTISITDIAAVLSDWANAGIVRIIQISASEYSITSLKSLDQGAKNFEFTLYEALFGDGVQTHTITAASARIRRVLPKVKRQVSKQCAALCGGRLFTLESTCVKYTALVLSAIPSLIVLSVGGYLCLDYSAGYLGVISSATLLLAHGIWLFLKENWRRLQRMFQILFLAICTVLELTILGGLIYYGFSALKVGIPMIFGVIASLFMVAVALLSGRRSVGYQTQLSQIYAYRKFLKKPEAASLLQAVTYYTKLPQAYVLRIGKAFSQKYAACYLPQNNGLVLLGDASKLSNSVGFYSCYLQFIKTVYKAEYVIAAPKSSTDDAKGSIGSRAVSAFHAFISKITDGVEQVKARFNHQK